MTIVKGENGTKVYALQYALHILNYNPGEIDGTFGDATESAVKLFQNDHGLTQTGHINGGTWLCISEQIKGIQQALANRGYYTDFPDGIASINTYNSIIAFPAANHLLADGIVGPDTNRHLNGYTGITNESYFPLGEGDSNEFVQYLQYGLHILWCHPGSIDGKFGPATTTATKEFQTRYSLTADGLVGSISWGKLTSLIMEIQTALKERNFYTGKIDGIPTATTYRALVEFQRANNLADDAQMGPLTSMALLGTTSVGGSDDLPLSSGSSGKKVLYLQYALTILCINPNGFDGNFGPGTEAAVREYQIETGLAVTGIADVETWMSISDKIKIIQQALVNHGYDTGGVDGVAGDGTYSAVLAFQTAKGLDADGMVGPYTRELLDAPIDATSIGTTSSILSIGSHGTLTKYLKHMLNGLGADLKEDGIFDEATHNAVIAFQSHHYLTPDGVVGPGTWNMLFTQYHVPVEGNGIVKFVNIAKHEADFAFEENNSNNITPYGEWYGMNGQPWCAMFVSWCAYQAGLLNTIIPSFAYCPYGVNDYIANGRYYPASSSYIPSPGDIIFFIDSNDDTASHTGIVVDVTNSEIQTVEGNALDKVGYNYYAFTDPYLLGYGCNTNLGDNITVPLPTTGEINSACAAKLANTLRGLGISARNENSSLYMFGLNNVSRSIEISENLSSVYLPLTENVDLLIAAATGSSLYEEHNQSTDFTFGIDIDDIEYNSESIFNYISTSCEAFGVDIDLTTDIFNSISLAIGNSNACISVSFEEDPEPSIAITITFKVNVDVTAYYSTELSYTLGILIHLSRTDPLYTDYTVAFEAYNNRWKEIENEANEILEEVFIWGLTIASCVTAAGFITLGLKLAGKTVILVEIKKIITALIPSLLTQTS